MTKVAEADQADELAKQYALYQIGFLSKHDDSPDSEFLKQMTVRANFVQ